MDLFNHQETTIIPPPDIVVYNELRSCSEIYRMYKQQQLDLKPYFQRNEVWKTKDKTLFIDSLIKQLPIPSMCISFDYSRNRRIIIDGVQRILAIISFLNEEKEFKLSKMESIDQTISGKSNTEIRKHQKNHYQAIENLTIPITVVRCDMENKDHQYYIYTIFQRLNTGGIKLSSQEIRNAIYHGKFSDLLRSFRENEGERIIKTIFENKNNRFEAEELILRFYSFYKIGDYKAPLGRYLNESMDILNRKNKTDDDIYELKNEITEVLKKSIKILKIWKELTPKLSNVFYDAIFYGIISNNHLDFNLPFESIEKLYHELRGEKYFSDENLKDGIFSTIKTNQRLTSAKKIFNYERNTQKQ